MEQNSSLADQEDYVKKDMGPFQGRPLEDFWNYIDEWTDKSIIGRDAHAEYHDHVPNHEEMYQECLNFDEWAWEGDRDASNAERITGTGQSFEEVLNRFANNRIMRWNEEKKIFEDVTHLRQWPRAFAIPYEYPESFPTICKFLDENKHQYTKPVISRMGPGAVIIPHRHNLIRRENRILGRMLYNMCINFPEGCKFAMHPFGVIPYKAGDIYRLWVHEGVHSVINNTDKDRFHIMLRPANYSEYVPEVS